MNGYINAQDGAPSAPPRSTNINGHQNSSSIADTAAMQQQQHLVYQQQQMQVQHAQQMQVQHAQQAHQAQQQAQQQQQVLSPAPGAASGTMQQMVPAPHPGAAQNPVVLAPPSHGGQVLPTGLAGSNSNVPHHPIAEFLYQLTKMLSDNNDEIVEWTNGRIKVHYPDRLEGEVLHKYFRHSKFASFQRQLNYFGFRKIAGKGKMSPCSYVNDGATTDIRSLLGIKRKTNGSAARKAAMAQAQQQQTMMSQPGILMQSGPTAAMTVDLFKNAFAVAGMTPQQMQALQGMAFAAPGSMLLPNNVAYAQVAAMQAHQQNSAAQQAASMQQRPLNESLYFPSDNALAQLAHGQRKQSAESMQSLATAGPMQSTGSLEGMSSFGSFGALQRQSALNLAALFANPLNYGAPYVPFPAPSSGAATAALNGLVGSASGGPAPANHAGSASTPAPANSQGGASAALASSVPSGTGAATAALAAAMPSGAATAALGAAGPASATAAMRAATAQTTNMFENNANLNALLGKEEEKAIAPAPAQGNAQNRFSNSNLMRLPSSGAFFPDSFSSVSLNGLLPGMSSNRLNSMLSLSSFLSRDPSMVDFAGNGSNYAGPNYAGTPFSGLSSAPLSALTAGAPLSTASLAALQAAGAFSAGFSSGYSAPASLQGVPGCEPTPIQDIDVRR